MTTLHQASGRWRLGLLLALLTSLLWATLPVALKVALEAADPWTITWFRFAVSGAVLLPWLAWRGRLQGFGRLSSRGWTLLVLAAAVLTGNYVAYVLGLDSTTPATAQLLIQLALLLMALGGIFVFLEPFSRGQWLGLAVMLTGLLLFFTDQLGAGHGGTYVSGALLIVLAAVLWAIYALAQKQLLLTLRSDAVMGFIYVFAAIVLWPSTRLETLASLDPWHAAALTFCALNTVAAYGAFAEALAHWEATRVSAVLALTPLFTVIAMELAVWLVPGLVPPERITVVGWAGAALVVGGSMAVSLLTLPVHRAAVPADGIVEDTVVRPDEA
jgi:drug/metabolite transporter (DMT)-like permease